MGIDPSKLSPAPWECGPFDGGVSLLWATNKNGACTIAQFRDEGIGGKECERNAAFAALARNAFDVMLRRGWWVVPVSGANAWQIRSEDDAEEKVLFGSKIDFWPDPFTALVEADKWYLENVENQEPARGGSRAGGTSPCSWFA